MKRKGSNQNKKSKNKKQSKKKEKEEESKEEINKHSAIKDNKTKEKKQELTEKEINEKLKEIYTKIEKKDFSTKPEYLNITTYNNITQSHKDELQKLSQITEYIIISPIELLYKQQYEQINKISNEKDKCSICQYNFYEDENPEEKNEKNEKVEKNEKDNFEKYLKPEFDVILLNKCHDHFFHIDCISHLINNKDNFKCPNCSIIYGILIGDMPKGIMSAYISTMLHCKGFKNIGTIVIDYYFPSGKNYSGTSRECYLPNNKEGKEILGLLKVAFDRKLTFTIGTSVTTGRSNTTVWNGIHHKTNLSGGPTHFGYPDDTYFNRVKEELAAKGVFKDNIDKEPEVIAEELISNHYDNFQDFGYDNF